MCFQRQSLPDVFFPPARSMTNVFYFGQAQTVGLTLFGITAGVIMRFTHRYKVRLPFSSFVQF